MGSCNTSSKSANSKTKITNANAKLSHNPYEYDSRMVKDSSKYQIPYDNKYYGSVSYVTAGQVYKANKNGNIEVLPETINLLYNEANDKSSLAIKRQRYNQDHIYYDDLERLTKALLNQDYISAQIYINRFEYDRIRLAGKKSNFYKYQSKLKE